MKYSDLKDELNHVDYLVNEINRIAPAKENSNLTVRGELSGLLLVAMCAIYENMIKQIMIEYADSVHSDFSYYIEKKYEKLNSKITKKDLEEYLKLFSPRKEKAFKSELERMQKYLNKVHPNEKYQPLLSWRHSYAHSKTPLTTIEEAYEHHRYAKLIIYAFNRAIECS
ncbi:hypothetical protein E0H80_16405 [Acinetobacter sp. ANC 4779]|uniref:HEPN domain-containing protein n=1 Tax=Acinetobacter sp. ANC 4779 TaxID=2529848 RepID=UPI00103F74E9|nr:HEPN domain-containing protein [Acinetobacter sp. ANC 4779]TCB47046.1 hypothetical protein E0H80_16405 [Acinetobacter sp. ANC 4779]